MVEHGIDAYVADTMYRKCDPRFKDAERHVPRKSDAPFSKPKKEPTHFQNSDFKLADGHSIASARPANGCTAVAPEKYMDRMKRKIDRRRPVERTKLRGSLFAAQRRRCAATALADESLGRSKLPIDMGVAGIDAIAHREIP
ncbi:MAG: hypothetical protein H7Y02_05255 [Candidatus Obscuribacterales bacterium]|nr:hypothetical protein [Steroidobacteraceae bacterium]